MTQTQPESPYDFRDAKLAADWEAQIASEASWRRRFFDAIASKLNAGFRAPFSLLELGSGPGHLARAIRSRSDAAASDYTAIDYSPAMHDLARGHLGSLADGVRFEVRDFRRPDWTVGLGPFDAAVTFMAAHEVRQREKLAPLFTQVAAVLKPGGLFLFADFYATDQSHQELYLSREGQAAALAACDFERVELLRDEQGMALYGSTRRETDADGVSNG